MKYKSLFLIAHKSNKGISKKVIFISIITLIFLLIFIPFTFYKTYSKGISFILNSDHSVRIIQLYNSPDISHLNLEENKHIVKIEPDYNFYQSTAGYWSESNSHYSLSITPNIPTFTPEVVKGKNLTHEYDMICPLRMAIGIYDDKNINDLIDMKEYLNKDLDFTFYKIVGYDDTKEEYIREPYKFTFKLVGLFDASLNYEYSSCYIKEDTLNNIVKTTYPFDSYKAAKITAIYVDDYKNLEEINKYLTDNNIETFISQVDTEFLDITLKSSLTLIVLFIIFSILLLINYLNIFIRERKTNLALYKALGFDIKDIKTIMYFSILELLCYSLLIAWIITFIAKYIILFCIKDNVTYMALNIKISYLPAFIYILVIMLAFKFIISVKVKKYYSYSVKDIGE